MAQHSALTGADLHEPKGVAAAPAGQVYVSNGAGSGSWQDPLSNLKNLNAFDMEGVINDVSTPNESAYVRVGRNATLTNILFVMSAPITVNDSVISLYRDGVLLGQTRTVAIGGSGEGVKFALNLSPTYDFDEGQVLKLVSNGNSDGTSKVYFTCKFVAR